jgi:ATP/ADP translocase
MKRIITLTLMSDIGGCLAMLLFFTITDNWGIGLYAGVMTFGNILLPTLIAVLIYQIVKNKTKFDNHFLTITIQTILLAGLFIFGLFLWASADAIAFTTLTWNNVIDDYNAQFSGFLPVVFTEALLIPTIDLWLTKRQKNEDTSA